MEAKEERHARPMEAGSSSRPVVDASWVQGEYLVPHPDWPRSRPWQTAASAVGRLGKQAPSRGPEPPKYDVVRAGRCANVIR